MKKPVLYLLSGLFSLFLLASCQSDDGEDDPQPDNTTSRQSDQEGGDAADEAIEDVNDFINNKIGGGSNQKLHSNNQKTTAYDLPCGVVSVDSSQTSGGNKVYEFNYGESSPCGYKKKSGTVSFNLTSGSSFADAGAVFTMQFIDYTVEIVATGKEVTLNGTITVTNLNGGYVYQAVTESATIDHKVRGSFDVLYMNGETRNRNYFQKRTWSSKNGWAGLTFTVSGDTTINSKQVSETGFTYDGNHPFITELTVPFKWGNCGTTWAGPYRLQEGKARMNVEVPNITPAYYQVEAGFYWNYTNALSTPAPATTPCDANAYKITGQIGDFSITEYQLY